MELGISTQATVPCFRYETDPDAEHTAIMNDMNYAIMADRAGFKYVQLPEHHFLEEFSHMSSPEVALGYLAHATRSIHLLAGIFSPMPKINHPARLAERVAMLDHLSNGRIEFGTGRGAGGFETLAFMSDLESMNETKLVWEDVIGEFAKMWTQDVYEGHQSKYWSLPPRKVLPRPWKAPHPPMWYAAGNVSSWEAAARKGLGVLGFSIDTLDVAEKAVHAYKSAIGEARPVGAYTNDYLMAVTFASVSYDREKAEGAVTTRDYSYNISQMYRFHDTFPRAPGIPEWPQVLPPMPKEIVGGMRQGGAAIGTPEDALQAFRLWEKVGVDGVLVSLPSNHYAAMETIELLGRHVIPEIDKDRAHRTDRFRGAAAKTLSVSWTERTALVG